MTKPLFWLFWALLYDATPDAWSNQTKPAPALSLEVLRVSSVAAPLIRKPGSWLFWAVLRVSFTVAVPLVSKPANPLFWAVLYDAALDPPLMKPHRTITHSMDLRHGVCAHHDHASITSGFAQPLQAFLFELIVADRQRLVDEQDSGTKRSRDREAEALRSGGVPQDWQHHQLL